MGRFALISVAVLALGLLAPVVLETAARVVMSPVTATRSWFAESSASLPRYLRDRQALTNEIRQLEQERSSRSGTQLTIARLQAENEQFRALLGATTSPRLLASVIARPSTLPYDVLQIDRGSEDGVIENAPVFLGYDTVIGFVGSVESHTALVHLVTSPGYSSTVYIVGPNIYTQAEGLGGGVLRVLVPQGIPLAPGNLVILPAVDAGVYGEVASVEAVPTQPQQYGYVPMSVPLQSLRFVSVGRYAFEPHDFAEAAAVVDDVQAALFSVPVPAGVLVDERSTSTASTTPTTTPLTSVSPEAPPATSSDLGT